jgi:2-C-methyl-D-erythritol 4-phosphate cytidylyltransferase
LTQRARTPDNQAVPQLDRSLEDLFIMSRFAVILPAAGRSTRFGATDPKSKKIYAEIDGRAVWLRAADPFLNRDDVSQIVIAISPEDRELFERRYQANVAFLGIKVVEGGAERHDSIANALAVIDSDVDFIAIHDAARPCVTPDLVDAIFKAAQTHGAAILGVPVADTLKRVDALQIITETVPRSGLYGAQTPQVFRADLLRLAYNQRTGNPTDDAMLIESLGQAVHVVE